MIYTKNGDKGKSDLINKKEISKSDIVFDVLGTVDELSAFLALAKIVCSGDFFENIETIQSDLIKIGAACAGGNEFDFLCAARDLEEKIDALKENCPCELVIYGKNEKSARLDVARAVCRRCERVLVKYCEESGFTNDAVAYFNRLSDYLYILARCFEKEENK